MVYYSIKYVRSKETVSTVRNTVLCQPNKIASKRFIKTFHQFTGEEYDIVVKWFKKKVRNRS